jgi:hypothetical protein
MSGLVSSRAFSSRTIFAVILFLSVGHLFGQEGLRMSLAGEEAAAARQKANGMPDYYNLKWGDFQLRLQSSLGIEADDNIRLVQSNRESDILFSPGVGIIASYPLSQQNTLNLNVNGGYSFYLQHHDLNQFFVRPGTELSFDFYIKDAVLLNVHNRLTVINQAFDNAAVGGRGNYSYLENTSGLSATWDLNLVEIVGGYDHVLRRSLTSAADTQNGSEDLFHSSAGFRVGSASRAGVEGTVGLIRYDQPTLNGGIQYTAGLFYKGQLSQNISMRISGGYYIYNLDSTGITTNNNFQSSVDAFYGSINLTHRVNSRLNYALEAGRQLQTGLFSDTLDLYYARLQADWGFVRKFPFSASFSYENGDETGGAAEKIQRFGYGAGVSWAVTRKLASRLWYQGYTRNSNIPSGRYTQNQVSLTLNYSF